MGCCCGSCFDGFGGYCYGLLFGELVVDDECVVVIRSMPGVSEQWIFMFRQRYGVFDSSFDMVICLFFVLFLRDIFLEFYWF